ncbi:hypothetical protein FF2_042017 [Malus domestica]
MDPVMNDIGIVTDDAASLLKLELNDDLMYMLSSWALLLFLFSFPSEEKVNDKDGASDWGSSAVAMEVKLKWRAREERDLISLRFSTDFRVLLN